MGRPEHPLDPGNGPVARFAWELRQLRDRAGRPSYRSLARRAHFGASTLADAAKGERLPSLDVALAYALACGASEAEWRARWSVAVNSVTAKPPAEVLAQACPYRGLATFQPEDAEWFFGRAHLLERLAQQVRQAPLIAVFGASGSGKSSLLRAGLLPLVTAPQVDGPRWRVVLMTPGMNPVTTLVAEVAKLADLDPAPLQAELSVDVAALDIALRTALAGGPADTRILLVVDQFEEIFTLCRDPDERDLFVKALLDAAHGPARRTTVVLGIRADFLSHCLQHGDLVSHLRDDAQVLVGSMAAADLRDVIVRPAAKVDRQVEPDLVATVIADAAAEPGALPLVSHVLLETWRRHNGTTLRLVDYHASGGVRGGIAQTAERVYAACTSTEQQVVRRIFLRLTALGDSTEDTRRPIARTELDGIAEADVVLARLVDARLIVVDADVIEVAHEALIRAWPRLHRWLTDDRVHLQIHRRLTEAAQNWDELAADAGALYRGVQLDTARGWAGEHPTELNELEKHFLGASVALDRRRTRVWKRLVAAMAVLTLVAALSGFVALEQRSQARAQQRLVLAHQLALQARSLFATDLDLAGLLAMEAFRLNGDAETIGSLLSAAAAPRHAEMNLGGATVYQVAFNSDRSLIASAHADGTVKLWDPARRTHLSTLKGHAQLAGTVAFNRDGTRLASTAGDESIIVWDVPARQALQRFTLAGLSDTMAFSADGATIAVSRRDGAIVLLHPRDDTRATLTGHEVDVAHLSFSPDGKQLAAVDWNGVAAIWDPTTGRRLAILPPHTSWVAFDTRSPRLATVSQDGIRLWDLGRSVRQPTTFMRRTLDPMAVSALVDGRIIAIADVAGMVTIWDVEAGLPLQSFRDRAGADAQSLTLSDDGSALASAGFGGRISVRIPARQPFGGHVGAIGDVALSPNGRVLVSAGSDRTARFWDADTGEQLGSVTGRGDQLNAITFNPNGRLVVAASQDGHLTFWDARSRQEVGTLRHPNAGPMTDIAVSPNGDWVAVAAMTRLMWDITELSRPQRVPVGNPSQTARALTFSPDGRHLLSTSVGDHLVIWDLRDKRQISRDSTGQGALQAVAMTPDGSVIATAGEDRTVRLWSFDTRQPIATLEGHTSTIRALAFSADGALLATTGDDESIIVWDRRTRRAIAVLTGHSGQVRSVLFTPDGTLISSGEDGRIIRWSLDPAAAAARLCRDIQRALTQQEWHAYLPDVPYRPSCDPSA